LFVETGTERLPLRQIIVDGADGSSEQLAPAADVKWSRHGEMFLLLPGAVPGAHASTAAADGLLLRLRSPGDLPEALATGVSQFLLHPSGDLLLGRSHSP